MITINRPAKIIAAALLGATVLATSAFAQEKTITGAFDVGPGGFQGNFNPLAATSGFTWLSLYLEPLVIYNAELSEIVGALSSDWQISEDQLTYTFTLVEETFHDGEALTSEDVAFTIKLAQDGSTGSVFAARLAPIASVETPDERTVVITLSAPNVAFLDTLTKILILPQHALADVAPADLATSSWWSTEVVGTGPFAFSEYVTDQYVALVADDDYRDGRPAIDRLINRYFENSAAAVSALRADEIQFTYVEPDDVSTFAGDAAYEVIEGASYVVNYIGFNQNVPLWDDIRVRQAVMHAIDREAIVESIYGGAATIANCGYVDERYVPDSIEPYAYDPDMARQLLEEAGWAELNGDQPITWLTYYTNPLASNVMAAIQAMLSEVGINVVPRAVDTPTYNGIIYAETPNNDEFPLVYAGLGNGPDASSINIGLNVSQIPPNGSNFLHIDTPEVSAALDAALNETDLTARDARYQEVCAAMNETLPWATLWVADRYGIASTKLQNFVWTPAPGGGPFDADAVMWDIAE